MSATDGNGGRGGRKGRIDFKLFTIPTRRVRKAKSLVRQRETNEINTHKTQDVKQKVDRKRILNLFAEVFFMSSSVRA